MTPLKALQIFIYFIMGLTFANYVQDGNWQAAMWVVVAAVYASITFDYENHTDGRDGGDGSDHNLHLHHVPHHPGYRRKENTTSNLQPRRSATDGRILIGSGSEQVLNGCVPLLLC